MVENQTGKKIKMLRTDNGTEYVNKDFQDTLAKSGIIHQRSVPHTPEQNGLAERVNRSIVEKIRCLLFDGQLSKSFGLRLPLPLFIFWIVHLMLDLMSLQKKLLLVESLA